MPQTHYSAYIMRQNEVPYKCRLIDIWDIGNSNIKSGIIIGDVNNSW